VQCLLLFHCSSGCTNVPRCLVIHTSHLLLIVMLVFIVLSSSLHLSSTIPFSIISLRKCIFLFPFFPFFISPISGIWCLIQALVWPLLHTPSFVRFVIFENIILHVNESPAYSTACNLVTITFPAVVTSLKPVMRNIFPPMTPLFSNFSFDDPVRLYWVPVHFIFPLSSVRW